MAFWLGFGFSWVWSRLALAWPEISSGQSQKCVRYKPLAWPDGCQTKAGAWLAFYFWRRKPSQSQNITRPLPRATASPRFV
ncbi:hypothetical protein B0H11DRAFT_2094110 [Mycena galericulata]|nr:hypothetical protein B0H11DRAFT_2094110 [Mycena galericulata]